jgi:hypothetical protein
MQTATAQTTYNVRTALLAVLPESALQEWQLTSSHSTKIAATAAP